MVSNIACAKWFGTDNPSILKFLELLILILYLLQHCTQAVSPSLLAITVLHSSHVTVWIPYQDRTSLLKHIKLNVLWLSSIFCSIIIIFIRLSLLSFHYHKCSALTTRCFYFRSVITAFCTENSILFWTRPCISKIQLELMPQPIVFEKISMSIDSQ